MADSTALIQLDVQRGGRHFSIHVTPNMCNLLFSDSVDNATKTALMNNILDGQLSESNSQPSVSNTPSLHETTSTSNASKTKPRTPIESTVTKPPKEVSYSESNPKSSSSISTTPSLNETISTSNASKAKPRTPIESSITTKPPKEVSTSESNSKSSWTESEERLLIDERHIRSAEFLKTRNHSTLWEEIAQKLLQVLNTKITGNQAMYKYNSLKKKWKEVIDAPSGSAAKKFVHKDSFDNEYGTKASTRPAFVLDTDDEPNSSSISKEGEKKLDPELGSSSVSNTKFNSKCRKRKYDLHTLIQKQHEEFLTKTTKMHEEKLDRFDKFLKLIEQSIQGKKEDK